MTNQEERHQEANKEKVIHHFKQLLEEILPEPVQRIETKEPARVKESIHQAKEIQSRKKQLRQKPTLEE